MTENNLFSTAWGSWIKATHAWNSVHFILFFYNYLFHWTENNPFINYCNSLSNWIINACTMNSLVTILGTCNTVISCVTSRDVKQFKLKLSLSFSLSPSTKTHYVHRKIINQYQYNALTFQQDSFNLQFIWAQNEEITALGESSIWGGFFKKNNQIENKTKH